MIFHNSRLVGISLAYWMCVCMSILENYGNHTMHLKRFEGGGGDGGYCRVSNHTFIEGTTHLNYNVSKFSVYFVISTLDRIIKCLGIEGGGGRLFHSNEVDMCSYVISSEKFKFLLLLRNLLLSTGNLNSKPSTEEQKKSTTHDHSFLFVSIIYLWHCKVN